MLKSELSERFHLLLADNSATDSDEIAILDWLHDHMAVRLSFRHCGYKTF